MRRPSQLGRAYPLPTEFQSMALCLTRLAYRENDLIVRYLTEDEGLLPSIVRGAQGAKSKLAGACNPLSLINGYWQLSPSSSLCPLRQYEGVQSFPAIHQDLEALSIASLLLEFISQCLAERNPEDGSLLDTAKAALSRLEILSQEGNSKTSDPDSLQRLKLSVLTQFQCELMQYLGLLPDWLYDSVRESPLDLERPTHWFSVQQGAPLSSESKQEMGYQDKTIVPISTRSLLLLNGFSQGRPWEQSVREVDLLLASDGMIRVQRFLRHWFESNFHRSFQAYEFMFSCLDVA